MVIALDSGSSGLGSSPSRGHCVVFLGKTLCSHIASLHSGVQIGTRKYAGVTLRWISIPSRGSSNTPSRFMLRKPELSAGLMGHLDLYKGFTINKPPDNKTNSTSIGLSLRLTSYQLYKSSRLHFLGFCKSNCCTFHQFTGVITHLGLDPLDWVHSHYSSQHSNG